MEEHPNEGSAGLPPAAQTPAVDPEAVKTRIAELQFRQNLVLGILAGLTAAVVGAGLWAAVTVATERQIGWMAVGVGFLVGLALRYVGRGVSVRFGIAGAALALFGCLLGNVLSGCAFVAQAAENGSYLDVLRLVLGSPAKALELLKVMFSPMDLLFYGLAVYAGYRYSFRRIIDQEVAKDIQSRK